MPSNMFRLAINTFPRACTSTAPLLAAGCAGYVHMTHDRRACPPVKCEPKPAFGWDTIKGLFTSKAAPSYAPLVICGPSGVGKGTLLKRLMEEEFPGKFGFCVSTTTRGPRPGEVDGKDYHFVDKDTMAKQIDEGKFVEHAKVHANMYGTSIAALEAVNANHKIVIMDIDIQGAKQVKEKIKGAHFIFLVPPSLEILESRLRGRGTEKEDKIKVRMQNALGEIEFSKTPGFWDKVIVADDQFAQALPAVCSLLKEWYPQLR